MEAGGTVVRDSVLIIIYLSVKIMWGSHALPPAACHGYNVLFYYFELLVIRRECWLNIIYLVIPSVYRTPVIPRLDSPCK
jgi:hypothetical protein